MSQGVPTLIELIQELEGKKRAGIEAITYCVDRLLAVLRAHNTADGERKSQGRPLIKDVVEFADVLSSREREIALYLLIKAAGIHHQADQVEAWLADMFNEEEK